MYSVGGGKKIGREINETKSRAVNTQIIVQGQAKIS